MTPWVCRTAALLALGLGYASAQEVGQDAAPRNVAEGMPASASQGPVGPSRRQAAAAPAPADRLDLEASVVTGNRELPKVLYIVPWKKAEPGDIPAQPFNTLLDEALSPVDRDVFRREVTYYGLVSRGRDAGTRSDASATDADLRQ